MLHLRNLTVLILGLGDSGLAMARWCVRCGAREVRVADTRDTPPQAAALREQLPSATLHQGLSPECLQGVDLVLKSPGLSPLDPELRPLLARADEHGIAVRGELSLFASALADLKATRGYAPKVLAITGTNGKTTTTALTAHLVQRAGMRVGMAGNIGPTLLDTLAQALDTEPVREHVPVPVPAVPAPEAVEACDADAVADPDEDPDLAVAVPEDDPSLSPLIPRVPPPPAAPVFTVLPEVWVLELSSFQLDGVSGFEPDASVVLNLSEDHLDWHGSMAAYAQAKASVYGRHTTLVINRDDPRVEAMVPPPELLKSGVRGRAARTVHRRVVRFGLGAPTAPGDFGLLKDPGQDGMVWLVRAREADPTLKRRTAEDDELLLQRLMPADALRIRGRHNAANALAALALATAIGVPLAPMLHGLRDYAGEPHRVEWLTTVRGVDAIDDSKGTNVGATVAALQGLGADQAPGRLVVILGGDGKGQSFAPLREPIAQHARAVALIGRDAPAIEAALGATDALPVQRHATLEEATRWAFAQALPGDAVLLSPACASLDMFRNYAHRAQVFADTVRELALDAGEPA